MATTTLATDRNRYCEAWAQMMVDIWRERAIAYNVHAGDLFNSFAQDVVKGANGEVDKITHAFNHYGRFVDMGVGRGVPLEKVESSNRRAKPFYNESYWRSIKVLTQKLAELYGEEFQTLIHDAMRK